MLLVNCHGLKDSKMRFDVLNYLHETKANIICLPDTHWTDNDVKNVQQIMMLKMFSMEK